MSVRTVLISSAAVASLTLAGCASTADDGAEPSSGTTPSTSTSSSPTTSAPAPAGVTVDIVFKDGKITPAGSTVKVPLGEPVTLDIQADAAGELHVHSEPEAHVEFGVGKTTKTLTFERPGVIEVELHDPNTLVVNLQVS